MKNIIIKSCLIGMILIAAASCSDDFLELSPQQSVSNEDALVEFGDFQSSITAVYNGLSTAAYYGRYMILVPDVMSDDVKQHPSANRAKDYAEYGATRSDGIASGLWREIYQNINSANAIINTDIEVPAGVQDAYTHIKGEALALRGLLHFDLVRMFAQHYTFTSGASHLGVPIILDFDQLREPSRNPVNEVYAQIVSDMTAGLAIMSDTPRSGNTATLSKTAVKAFLARVYLYMDDLPNSESTASEVINGGKYSLVNNSNYLAMWASDFSSESIFEISMTESDNRGSDALGRMYIVEGYGDYLPSNDLVSQIPADDARAGWFITDPVLSGDYAPFRMNKYPSIAGDNNTIVMRLSELYLIRAEARARMNSNDAQGDIDVIRQRAQPSAAPVTATGADLVAEALLEKRKEMCYEGQRLWDLMRHKSDVVRTQCTSSICLITYPSERTILPIPENELDANPNIEPNPGF